VIKLPPSVNAAPAATPRLIASRRVVFVMAYLASVSLRD